MEIHKLVNSDWCLQFTIQNEGFVEQAVICRKGLYVNIILFLFLASYFMADLLSNASHLFI